MVIEIPCQVLDNNISPSPGTKIISKVSTPLSKHHVLNKFGVSVINVQINILIFPNISIAIVSNTSPIYIKSSYRAHSYLHKHTKLDVRVTTYICG